MLVVGRAITGMAAGTWVVMVVSYNSLFAPGESLRATAMVNLINSIGMIAGTALTGWLNGLGGYRLPFMTAILTAGLAAAVMIPGNEQPRPPQKRSFSAILSMVTRREVLLASLLGVVAQYAAWSTGFSFIPILIKQYGASDVIQSMVLSLNIATVLIGNLAVTAAVKKFGAARVLYLSFGLMACGLACAAAANSLALVFIAQFLNGFGLGIGFSILMGRSIENAAETEKSTAMGLFQSVYSIGMFAGPWLSGYLAGRIGIQPMFGATAAAVLLLGVGGVWFLI